MQGVQPKLVSAAKGSRALRTRSYDDFALVSLGLGQGAPPPALSNHRRVRGHFTPAPILAVLASPPSSLFIHFRSRQHTQRLSFSSVLIPLASIYIFRPVSCSNSCQLTGVTWAWQWQDVGELLAWLHASYTE